MFHLSRIFVVFFLLSAQWVSAVTVEIAMEDMVKPVSIGGLVLGKSLSAEIMSSEHYSINASSFSDPSVVASRKQNVLLLKVSFKDQEFSYGREDFEQLMFSTQSGVSSVANYYLENSYQDFLLQPAMESQGKVSDGIIEVRLPYDHPNFGANYGSLSTGLVRDAMAMADQYIDLKQYDKNSDRYLAANELAIVLMVAGYENAYGGGSAPKPNVWAHKADITAAFDGISLTGFAMFGERHQNHLATIGIISHEMGHLLFSLPDLYDRQGDSNGIGRWGLMGLGSWNSQGGYSGSSPAHMMAWSKVKAGFLVPQDVVGDALEFNLESTSQGPEAMRIWLDPFRHGEHFLLEHRTSSQLDRGLPGHGLLISHIDDWVGYGIAGPQNDVAEHKLVDIEEADGRGDLDQLENRGDRLDVFNDAYGQDYFGSGSMPASSDYHGNSSGVEISNIQVTDSVSGVVTLPYQTLGNNLGFDEGGIGGAWGVNAGRSISLQEYDADEGMDWVHGVDVFSHGHGEVEVTLFASLQAGIASDVIFTLKQQSITPGWNRISFTQPVDISRELKIYLQLDAQTVVGRAFSIDTKGEVSGRSYAQSGAGFQKVGFDFNQRLLVADQSETFNYQVPKKMDINLNDTSTSAGALSVTGWGWVLFLILLAITFTARAEKVN